MSELVAWLRQEKKKTKMKTKTKTKKRRRRRRKLQTDTENTLLEGNVQSTWKSPYAA